MSKNTCNISIERDYLSSRFCIGEVLPQILHAKQFENYDPDRRNENNAYMHSFMIFNQVDGGFSASLKLYYENQAIIRLKATINHKEQLFLHIHLQVKQTHKQQFSCITYLNFGEFPFIQNFKQGKARRGLEQYKHIDGLPKTPAKCKTIPIERQSYCSLKTPKPKPKINPQFLPL